MQVNQSELGKTLVDVTLHDTVSTIFNESRARTLKRLGRGDAFFRMITKASALGVLIVLGAIFVSLVLGAALAFQTFGLDFFVTESWNPVTEKFGARAPIVGTLVTSFIAMLIAVPIGLGIAIFLTELCPPILRRPIGIAIELLAGVPSIIYGIWGLFVFAPFLQANVQPALISAFGSVPVLSSLFAGPPYGIGVLTASLILAIMVLPFITAVSRDVFETVPVLLKEFGLWDRLHHLGGDPFCDHPLYTGRLARRGYARPGARIRRDDGGHICHRQRSPVKRLDPRAWNDYFSDDRQ